MPRSSGEADDGLDLPHRLVYLGLPRLVREPGQETGELRPGIEPEFPLKARHTEAFQTLEGIEDDYQLDMFHDDFEEEDSPIGQRSAQQRAPELPDNNLLYEAAEPVPSPLEADDPIEVDDDLIGHGKSDLNNFLIGHDGYAQDYSLAARLREFKFEEARARR